MSASVTGYFREAESLFRQVVDIDPLSSGTWWRLADSLMAQGRDDEAKEALRSSASLDDSSIATGRLFYLALIVGDDKEAQRLLEPIFDAEYFRYPSPAEFISAMRNAETGRAALQQWVEYRAANIEILDDRNIAYGYNLLFGHMAHCQSAAPPSGPRSRFPYFCQLISFACGRWRRALLWVSLSNEWGMRRHREDAQGRATARWYLPVRATRERAPYISV